jgi:hypothetical protein
MFCLKVSNPLFESQLDRLSLGLDELEFLDRYSFILDNFGVEALFFWFFALIRNHAFKFFLMNAFDNSLDLFLMLLFLLAELLDGLLLFKDLLFGMLFEVCKHLSVVLLGLGFVFSKLQFHLLGVFLILGDPFVGLLLNLSRILVRERLTFFMKSTTVSFGT